MLAIKNQAGLRHLSIGFTFQPHKLLLSFMLPVILTSSGKDWHQIRDRNIIRAWDSCTCVRQNTDVQQKGGWGAHMRMRERSCAGAELLCPTSHRFLHYLMCCRLLCPVHCEPQKHIRGTAIQNWDADCRLNNEETEFITSEWWISLQLSLKNSFIYSQGETRRAEWN